MRNTAHVGASVLARAAAAKARKATERAGKKEHERGARAYMQSSPAEAEDYTGADPQIVLPVVKAVGELRAVIVRFQDAMARRDMRYPARRPRSGRRRWMSPQIRNCSRQSFHWGPPRRARPGQRGPNAWGKLSRTPAGPNRNEVRSHVLARPGDVGCPLAADV